MRTFDQPIGSGCGPPGRPALWNVPCEPSYRLIGLIDAQDRPHVDARRSGTSMHSGYISALPGSSAARSPRYRGEVRAGLPSTVQRAGPASVIFRYGPKPASRLGIRTGPRRCRRRQAQRLHACWRAVHPDPVCSNRSPSPASPPEIRQLVGNSSARSRDEVRRIDGDPSLRSTTHVGVKSTLEVTALPSLRPISQRPRPVRSRQETTVGRRPRNFTRATASGSSATSLRRSARRSSSP